VFWNITGTPLSKVCRGVWCLGDCKAVCVSLFKKNLRKGVILIVENASFDAVQNAIVFLGREGTLCFYMEKDFNYALTS